MKKPNVFVRSAYNYDMDEVSQDNGLACPEPTLTQQQFKEESDINTIVERFHLTGQMPQLDALPQYADYEGVFDFQTAMNTIREAQETFMQLPANLRARFDNDPQKFLAFTADDKNIEEAQKLGILSPEGAERLAKATEKAEDERSAARAAARAPVGAVAPGAPHDAGEHSKPGKPGKT